MQTGVDGGRWERLEGTLLNPFRALGTGVSAAITLVTADVPKEANLQLKIDSVSSMLLVQRLV